ncbi:hypothetical protein [Flagellimonas sp. CMM7]|uniref:hypothetical protein n=1 Tax=Flagellimonas sp. CMM7 TaxID=2654676 RepID=UPI0013D3E4F7|nr:hypothetical protein [Flagellimonas sp. CMM7]UII78124.1 hypothetical protein LV704_10625 [Flagellimonas sp. CMM7]
MKSIILLLTFSLFAYIMNAQENYASSAKVGDQLVIGDPISVSYKNINVPRKNFIIKRGGIPNMSTLKKSIVTITKISESNNPVITFKRSDGKKFFKAYSTLTANLNSAINSGEMMPYQKKEMLVN